MPQQDNNQSSGSSFIQDLIPNSFWKIFEREKTFIILIGIAFFVAATTFPYPEIAMWVGFIFAGYSAIANDSIQTIGTFIASNGDKKWWVLWLFIGTIFLLTVTYSFVIYDGDVTHQRLAAKGFEQTPTTFTFLQIAAPIFLLILTRLRMPVSTTFLILSCFSANLAGIQSMLVKSLSGYLVAFVMGLLVYILVNRWIKKWSGGKAHWLWTPAQWITSGTLWATWVMQDAANIAVYLPRAMNINEFLGFAIFIFVGLGVLFYLRGDRIQEIVTEKSHILDVRSATVVDFIYAIILFYFKIHSNVPMSTTWVFLGLLAGREIAMSFVDARGLGQPLGKSLRMIWKDGSYALIGLAVSIILAISINPQIEWEIIELIKSIFN
jgi:hypothetical protein